MSVIRRRSFLPAGVLGFAAVCVAPRWAVGQAVVASTKPVEPTPVVAELPDNLNERLEELVAARRDIFAAFKAEGAAADDRVASLAPSIDVFGDAAAPDLVPAIRRLAQLQCLRHDFGGRRNVTMLSAASSKPADGLTFVEQAEWNAARLAALGDEAGAAMLAAYAGVDPGLPTRIARVLTAAPEARGPLVAAVGARLRERPFDDAACDEAILVIKRRLGSDADRAALREVMVALGPDCAQQLQNFMRALASGEKFSRTEQLVGTRDFRVQGALLDGTPFDSASLAGKVIVVDFWATWCGPCVAELPRLADLRQKHKDDGLEIVGVSNDYDRESLESFLKKHPEIGWPQLFDAASAANAEMHALARASGIQGIPALFVIDRKGVLRSVSARTTLETIVTELLAEGASP